MLLKNPPVEEVGIDIQFDPSPEKRAWDDVAVEFLDQFTDSFPKPNRGFAVFDEIRIEKRSPEGIPQELYVQTQLAHVTSRNKEETRFLRIGEDTMSYWLVRRGVEYPGFQVVLNEALEKFDQYVAFFQPAAIQRARLRYVDGIDIQRDIGGAVDLEDYLEVGIKVPDEPFGPVGEFAVRNSFPATEARDALQFVLRTQPTLDETTVRFAMEWHSLCENFASLSTDELTRRLARANDHLNACFFASFKEKGLALFNSSETPTT